MAKRRTVALLIETSNAYARGLLKGIAQYVRELKYPWSMHLVEQAHADPPPPWLANWKGDGIIVRIETQEIATAVEAVRVPIVDVSAARHVPNVPWVATDDVVIAHLAAEHLLDRGFRHFGFCGNSAFNWSNWRRDEFVRYLGDRGFPVHVLDASSSQGHYSMAGQTRKALTAWAQKLPKPVGVFATHDIRGQELLDACHGSGILVPDELAVIGVDNDEIVCDLSLPPLSSIAPDTQRSGYEAAHLLETSMAGRKTPPVLRIPPLGVVTRQSSDVLAIEDRDVCAALRFIRDHACDGIDVGKVVRHVPLSRRELENRFLQVIGRTPHQEILRVKIARATQLLTETDLGLDTIAERTGFRHPEYFCVAFKRETGSPPGKFRRLAAIKHHPSRLKPE